MQSVFLVYEAEYENKSVSSNQSINENIDPDGKYVALTFDDGPSAERTPRILSAFAEYNAKATFFWST